MRSRRRSHIISPQTEEILKTIHFYRYVTALDITHLHYSPKVLPYVRQRLTDLAGGRDDVDKQYLYRLPLPRTSAGNPTRVYTLGSRGRAYLVNELGIPVEWYYRPHKVKDMGYSQMLHNVLLTKFLVSARSWALKAADYTLVQTRISYELAERPATVTIDQDGMRVSLKVIPDAWLLFHRASNDESFPILFELDRGTQYQNAFKNHVRARLEYVRSGAYEETFGTPAVIIAYATTGPTPMARETRRKTLSLWTREVLTDMGLENWATVFRFHELEVKEMYSTPIFDQKVWHQPSSSAPLRLFGV